MIMDERAILSCKTLTVECDGKRITTIENLRNAETGCGRGHVSLHERL